MKRKIIICPQRLRRIPKQFSWVDHRLIGKGYIQRSSREGLALYLFLITVADADGISYYADHTISKLLNYDICELHRSRKELKNLGLIAYKRPFYQVLGLELTITDTTASLPLKKAVCSRDGNNREIDKNVTNGQLSEERIGKIQSIGNILNEIGGE